MPLILLPRRFDVGQHGNSAMFPLWDGQVESAAPTKQVSDLICSDYEAQGLEEPTVHAFMPVVRE